MNLSAFKCGVLRCPLPSLFYYHHLNTIPFFFVPVAFFFGFTVLFNCTLPIKCAIENVDAYYYYYYFFWAFSSARKIKRSFTEYTQRCFLIPIFPFLFFFLFFFLLYLRPSLWFQGRQLLFVLYFSLYLHQNITNVSFFPSLPFFFFLLLCFFVINFLFFFFFFFGFLFFSGVVFFAVFLYSPLVLVRVCSHRVIFQDHFYRYRLLPYLGWREVN